MERFTKAIRNDLLKWWDRCFVSEAERRAFTAFEAEIYTEQLLDLHESQVDKYTRLYNENKELFKKVKNCTKWTKTGAILNSFRLG